MIVSFSRQFVFVAIPKTAGHAIRRALRTHLAANDWEQCSLFEKLSFPVDELARIGHGHLSCQQLQPWLLPGMWERMFSFCFVRHPYDRFVSYCHFRHPEILEQGEPTSAMKRILRDPQVLEHVLFRPQHEFVTDEEGKLMVSRAARYESLQAEYDAIMDELSLPTVELNRVNATDRKPWQEYLDQELREQLYRFYQRDFELFGYSSELD